MPVVNGQQGARDGVEQADGMSAFYEEVGHGTLSVFVETERFCLGIKYSGQHPRLYFKCREHLAVTFSKY